MPRTAITPQDLSANNKINTVTWTDGDAANDHSFTNTGSELLLIKGTDASTKTVTVISVADRFGRTGDLSITVPAVSSGSDGVSIAGPFLPELWNQSGGVVNVDLTDATGLKFAVIRAQPIQR